MGWGRRTMKDLCNFVGGETIFIVPSGGVGGTNNNHIVEKDENRLAVMLLCRAVEDKSGMRVRTSRDFELLAEAIVDSRAGYVSASTLKRLWGYVKDTKGKHVSTLDVLARFAGYPKGYPQFELEVREANSLESGYDAKRVLNVMKLAEGELIEVEWLPDRKVVFRHLGDCLLEVVSSQNAKLAEGTRVVCPRIVEGEKLMVDIPGDGTRKPAVYEAGKINGVVWKLS